jgi:glucose uptake protein GlcU
MNELVWFIAIVITIIVWWIWLIIWKRASEKLNNNFLWNFLITIGALIFNILVFVVYYFYSNTFTFEYTYFLYPFIAWILWSLACLFAFISISRIWVWKAFSIWAPSSMIVSFLWWILYYDEFASNIIFASLAILIIIIWTIIVIKVKNKDENNKTAFSWIVFALLSSLIWWWTYLVPLKELSNEISPFYTLLPLSIWMLFWAFLIYWVKKRFEGLNLRNLKIWLPIILSWFMWWVWNLFAIIAVINIWIWKAYPMAELSWVINALLAVYVLKEIKWSSKIRIFLLWTFISFSWAIWLSVLKI